MKKILGISLCALFAVSAANAEIASKLYVDQEVGANESAIEGLTTRVNANESAISANEGNITTNTNSITTINGSMTTLTEKVNTLDTNIQGMDAETSGDYVTYVKQENGKVTATGADFETSVTDETVSEIAPTSKAVAAYVKGKVDGLGVSALAGRVIANEEAIAANASDIDTNRTNIGTNTTSIGNLNTSVNTLSGKVTANEEAIAANAGNIGTNTTAIEGINNSMTTLTGKVTANEGSIRTINTTIAGMSENETGSHFIQGVTQSNGTVVATGKNFQETLGATTTDNAPTSKAVADYVKSKMDGLGALAELNEVTSNEITNGTITNNDVAADAGIESGKIAFNSTQTTVFGSGITSDLVADINSNRNNLNAMLGEGTGYDTCKNSPDGCTLVVRNGSFSWEKVARATGETAQ